MKKSFLVIALVISTCSAFVALNGCYVSKTAAAKSGAELWGENCNRCHNAPTPGEFSNANWDIIGTHMQIRANLAKDDMAKIIDFLKSANN